MLNMPFDSWNANSTGPKRLVYFLCPLFLMIREFEDEYEHGNTKKLLIYRYHHRSVKETQALSRNTITELNS